MNQNSNPLKKKAQRERLLLREISELLLMISNDNPVLRNIMVRSVMLSPNKSICFVMLHTEGGEKEFKEKLQHLKLYKPSMRKALAERAYFRYVPDIRFKFDKLFAKEQNIINILDKLKEEEER